MKSNKRKFRIDGKVIEKVVGPVKTLPPAPKADSKPTEKPAEPKPV